MQTIQSWLSAPLDHLHLTPTRCLNVGTLLPLATICIALLASCAVNQGTHDYSATNPRALLAEGADAALATIERGVPADVRRAPFFATFAAGLEAERGNHERAAELAAIYRDRLNDPDAPGIDALESVLLQHRGDLRGALEAAERAVSKDPKHLIAARRSDWLRSQLD